MLQKPRYPSFLLQVLGAAGLARVSGAVSVMGG